MLDNRLHTFLTLCETQNFSLAAQKLNITQPAVSQHIQYLERYYQINLISQKGKKFELTEEGKMLQQYAMTLRANSQRIMSLLHHVKHKSKPLNFGSTLTIGEYTIPPILAKIFAEDPEVQISMVVENTQILQKMMWDGEIDFVLLEGNFRKDDFESKLISNEEFIGVCSPESQLADREVDIDELLEENLILRETGSGTRDIFERALYDQNLSIVNFSHRIVVGNMNAIKYLCHNNLGITFMYKEAAKKELWEGYLKKIHIRNFNVVHPFSFVYLKDGPDKSKVEFWYNKIMSLREDK